MRKILVQKSILWSQLNTRSLRQMLCGSLIKCWNLTNHMKKLNKKHQNQLIGEKLKTKGLMFFASIFQVICNISNSNMWTPKHLAQASFTELTLTVLFMVRYFYQLKLPLLTFYGYKKILNHEHSTGKFDLTIKSSGKYGYVWWLTLFLKDMDRPNSPLGCSSGIILISHSNYILAKFSCL